MSITFLSKTAKSFSLFEKKSHLTLSDYVKIEKSIKNAIHKVENKLEFYKEKKTISDGEINIEHPSNIVTQAIKEKLNSNNLISKLLRKISNHDKSNDIDNTITKLSKSLYKYKSQHDIIKKECKKKESINLFKEQVKLRESINKSDNKILMAAQATVDKEELTKIAGTVKKQTEESQLLALKNMEVLIEHFNNTPENLKKEGILRISPSKNILDSIVKTISKGDKEEIKEKLNDNNDPHVITGAIKQQFKLALSDNDKININELVKNFSDPENNNPLPLLKDLPPAIQKIMPLLANINEEKLNKMNEENLAICLAPNMMLDSYKNPLEAVGKYNLFLKCLILKAGTPPIATPRTR